MLSDNVTQLTNDNAMLRARNSELEAAHAACQAQINNLENVVASL